MKFEYDQRKSSKTKMERGIDFVEAQILWDDDNLLEIPAKTVDDEGRCLVIGMIGEKHWSAIITYRDDSLRIISVRRATKKEVALYES